MISLVGTIVKDAPTNHKLIFALDKSFADDLVASGYCKCESVLVIRSTEVCAAFLRFVLPCYFSSWSDKKNLSHC